MKLSTLRFFIDCCNICSIGSERSLEDRVLTLPSTSNIDVVFIICNDAMRMAFVEGCNIAALRRTQYCDIGLMAMMLSGQLNEQH